MARSRSHNRRLAIALCLAGLAATWTVMGHGIAANDVITTVAGNGERAYPSDGRPATSAGLDGPRAIASDGRGGFFVTDTFHHVIRHVDAGGTISTVAGTGAPGYGGDGGPATAALLDSPHGIDVDGHGNLLIGDPVNNRIRKVDVATGIITTIAGTGASGFTGDGGPATAAQLNDPKMAVSGPDGSIYIADMGNNRVRRVRPDGTITTFAGNGLPGQAGRSGDGGPATEAALDPRAIALDERGHVLVADRDGQKIRRVDARTGVITTIAGNGTQGDAGDGGPALEAQLNQPRGLSVDWLGNVYIGDSNNNKIRKISTDGIITTIAGTGVAGSRGDGMPATRAELTNPRHALVTENGDLLIADTNNNRVRRITGYVPPRPGTAQ